MSQFYVFVEGLDDERFYKWYFNKNEVKIVKYAKEKANKINDYIKSINSIPDANYIFTADADGKNINDKKNKIKQQYSLCELDKIFVSKFEIESWYLAGININNSNKYRIKYLNKTDEVTKEKFDFLIPNKFGRIDFLVEILKCFSCTEASNRNSSFNYFYCNNKRE